MNKHLEVGSTVQVTESYIRRYPNSTYIGKIGTISKIDLSDIPFRAAFPDANDYDWFRVGELELVTPESPLCLNNIKYIVLELMDGKVYYTPNGTKVYREKGMLKFGKSPLDLEKLVGVQLSVTDNSKPPFDIDKVRGTHCQVWDTLDGKKEGMYCLVNNYVPTDEYKFKTTGGISWKYAVPVK